MTRLDTNDLEAVEKSIKSNTKVIYIESLSNPHLNLADIPGLAKIAHDNGLLFIVDNTFLITLSLKTYRARCRPCGSLGN